MSKLKMLLEKSRIHVGPAQSEGRRLRMREPHTGASSAQARGCREKQACTGPRDTAQDIQNAPFGLPAAETCNGPTSPSSGTSQARPERGREGETGRGQGGGGDGEKGRERVREGKRGGKGERERGREEGREGERTRGEREREKEGERGEGEREGEKGGREREGGGSLSASLCNSSLQLSFFFFFFLHPLKRTT